MTIAREGGNSGPSISTVSIGGGGITINSGAQLTFTNNAKFGITLAASQTWINNSSNLFSVGAPVTNGANLLTISGTGNTTISGVIGGGSGGLTKAGGATLTLTGTNTYTGLTNITAGTLVEGVSNAISTGALTVNGATAVFDLGANHTDSVGTVTLDGGGSITGTGTSRPYQHGQL